MLTAGMIAAARVFKLIDRKPQIQTSTDEGVKLSQVLYYRYIHRQINKYMYPTKILCLLVSAVVQFMFFFSSIWENFA